MEINIKDIDYNNWVVKYVRSGDLNTRTIYYNKEKKLYMKNWGRKI